MKVSLIALIKVCSLMFLSLVSCKSESTEKAPTVSTPAEISGEDVDTILVFMNTSGTWQKFLIKDGREIGQLIGRMIKLDSYEDQESIRQRTTAFNNKIDAKIKEYQALKLPEVSEVQTFKKTLIAYLQFQKSKARPILEELLNIAVQSEVKKTRSFETNLRDYSVSGKRRR